jgi:flagellin
MSLSILNNIAALYAQNNLTSTSSKLQSTLQQLSSGSRINSGADDAAGLAVADGLGANVAALTQSSQNATSGIGLLQTADGALSQVTNLLDRAVTLATEASNGTLTSAQVSSANQEYQNILSQIGNIGSHTNFNSSQVFTNNATNIVVTDGTLNGLNTYADTIGALTTASVGTSAPTGTATSLAAITPTLATASAGATATIALSAGTNTLSGTLQMVLSGSAPGSASATFASGTSISAAISQLNQAGGQFATAGIVATLSGNSIVLTGPTGVGNDFSMTGTALSQTTAPGNTPGPGADFTTGGLGTLTANNAGTVLTTVTSAVADVAYQRGTIGANINQLASAANVASSEKVNLTSAQDSISATDYGQAASNLSKYQILSQTGISALAQANSVQQEVLKLLQ